MGCSEWPHRRGCAFHSGSSASLGAPSPSSSWRLFPVVGPAVMRCGIGRTLLARLIENATAAGFRQMIAMIGDSGNAASIGLHEQAGFARAGLLPAAGFKLGRWIDCVVMQRSLGEGSATPPV